MSVLLRSLLVGVIAVGLPQCATSVSAESTLINDPEIAQKFKETMRARDMERDNAVRVCPAVIEAWARELEPVASEASTQLTQIAETLSGLPNKPSVVRIDRRSTLTPSSKPSHQVYAKYMCPRWLIIWSSELRGLDRQGDCAIVAGSAQALSNVLLKELAMTTDSAFDSAKSYAQAMAKLGTAQATFCTSGKSGEAQAYRAVEQAQEEVLQLHQAIQLDSTAQGL